MRIAYLIREGPEQIVSPSYVELIESLQKRGHEITVLNETGSFNGFPCIKVSPKKFPDWPSGILNRLSYSKTVKPVLEGLKPEVVFSSFAEALYHLEKLPFPKVAVVNDEWSERKRFTPWFGSFKRFHFLPFPTQTRLGLLADEFYQLKSFRKADGVVCVNKTFKGKIRAKVDGPLITSIPNGVDAKKLKPNKKTVKEIKERFPGPIVLFLARLELQKNPLLFIRAAEEILKKNDAHFLVAGDGFLGKKCREMIEKRNLSSNVKMLGWVKGSKKNSLFKAADIYSLPSLFEPFGISALEALSLGCAVVCSNVGGLKELVSGGFALGFENQDLSGLAFKTSQLLENASLLKEFKGKAERARKQYSWERISKQYEEFLEKAVSFKEGRG